MTALLRPEEAADQLRIGRSALYELMRTGRLRSVRIGRSRRIPTSEIEGFIEEHLRAAQDDS